MLISVIIPAHNEEKHIRKCLSSFFKQSYKNYELIVVNDGSTDKTEFIVKGLQKHNKKIKLISFKKGHSAAFARNRGAEKAKGEILVFIDADQFVESDFLYRIVKNFQNKADALVGKVFGASSTFIGRCYAARKWLFWLTRQCKKQILTKDKPGCILAIRKRAFISLRGYDEKLFYKEDADFANRTKEKYSVWLDPSILVYHHDPENFNEVYRHALWVGKGIATELKKFGFVRTAKSLAEIFFWPILTIFVILSFFVSWAKYLLIILVFPIYYFFKTWYYSKDFIHSFCFLLLSIPKNFISCRSFIKNMLKNV